MKPVVLLLSCLAAMPSGAQSGEMYRWVDANGKVYYGDKAPADAMQVESKKFPDADKSGNNLSYETRRAQQNFPVILYVADNCAEYCDLARSLLNKRGIPFTEKSLKTRKELDAFKAFSGSSNVPTLGVGKSFLQGFMTEQWHSELDIVGYPKTVFYRPPVPLPASAPVAAGRVTPANPAAQ